jgi:large subunit ribosomal protein L31
MKKNIHPPYQEVLFVDSSTGFQFVTKTTHQPKEKAMFEGKEYPVCHVPISSSSHPAYTGVAKYIPEGRVDQFLKRYGKKKEAAAEQPKEAVEEKAAAPKKGVKKETKKGKK